jgi:hypothetical protein
MERYDGDGIASDVAVDEEGGSFVLEAEERDGVKDDVAVAVDAHGVVGSGHDTQLAGVEGVEVVEDMYVEEREDQGNDTRVKEEDAYKGNYEAETRI